MLTETMAALLASEKWQERSYKQGMVGLPLSGFDPARDRWWGLKPKESYISEYEVGYCLRSVGASVSLKLRVSLECSDKLGAMSFTLSNLCTG